MRTDLSITPEEVVAIHDMVLKRYGGHPGIRVQGCLEQSIGNAELAEQYSGSDDGVSGLCFIGSLMFYINKNQCFVDGNKRTSLAVALKLLGNFGLTLDSTTKELEDYCYTIANDIKDSSDVVRWIAIHARQV